MKETAYIYLMSNQHNTVLYIGVTNDLTRRIAEHKAKINKGFTAKYNVNKLVYFETTSSIYDAISREKQLKNWKRDWKNALINKDNPSWDDLSSSIGVDNEMIEVVRRHYQEIAGQARNDKQEKARNDKQEKARNDTVCHSELEVCHSELEVCHSALEVCHSELDSESHDMGEIAGQARNDERSQARNDGKEKARNDGGE